MNKLKKIILNRKDFLRFFSIRILVLLMSLIINIVIVRKLEIEEYGIFSIALMIVGFATNFGFSWSSSSILYFGGKERAINGNLNKTFWSRNIIIAISMAIVIILFIAFKEKINDYIGAEISYLILLWLFVSVIEDYLNQYFLAIKKQLRSALLSFTAKLLCLIVILIMDFDVETLLWINIISNASVIFYSLGINKNDVGKFEYDKEWFKDVLNFSLWQFFGFAGIYLINFGDTAVIKHYMTIEDVGTYNAAYNLFNAFSNLSFVISSYYAGTVSSYIATNNQRKIKEFFYKERMYILTVLLVVHLLVIISSNLFFEILYGEKYLSAVPIFIILIIGSFFRFASVFYMIYFNTTKNYSILQIINIVRAILNIILDIVLIQYFGLIGPAIATTISIFVTTIFSAYYCESKLQILSGGKNNVFKRKIKEQ